MVHFCANCIPSTILFVSKYPRTNPARNVSPAPLTSLIGTSDTEYSMSLYLHPLLPNVTISFSSNPSLDNNGGRGGGITSSSSSTINDGTVWYFAIPWTSSGLEEAATTLKSLLISPNPANTFVDISLDYNLKGESEVVFISVAGYISHKQSIGNISKNET